MFSIAKMTPTKSSHAVEITFGLNYFQYTQCNRTITDNL